MYNIFDSHAHYDDGQFDADRDALLASFKEAGIVGLINCATDVATAEISMRLAEKYDFIYFAAGIHPEQATDAKQGDLDKIKEYLKSEKCVAIGEIGLDYYYEEIPRDVQKDIFECQLKMALELNKPVIIHDREAHGDTLELLKKYKPRGVLHCYSGSVETAKELLKLGMYFGFGGAVTFKNAVKPVEAAAFIPSDRILVETDCPYMAPVPMRGKRNNSTYIEYVACKLGEIRNEEPQAVLNYTYDNARKLFGI